MLLPPLSAAVAVGGAVKRAGLRPDDRVAVGPDVLAVVQIDNLAAGGLDIDPQKPASLASGVEYDGMKPVGPRRPHDHAVRGPG